MPRRFVSALQLLFLEPWSLWAGVLGPFMLIVLINFEFPTGDSAPLLAGYALSVAGFLFVVRSVNEAQRLFGRLTVLQRVADWWRRVRALIRPPRHQMRVAASAGGMSMVGHATAVLGPRNNTISERLQFVEREIKRLEALAATIQADARTEIASVRQAITDEATARQAAHTLLNEQVTSFATGGMSEQVLGAIWAIIGQFFATFPDMSHQFARHLSRLL